MISREFDSLSPTFTAQVYPSVVDITTPASATAVSLDMVKEFLHVNDTLDDDKLELLINAVQLQVERYINRSLMLKTYTARWLRFSRFVRLPYIPIVSISSVQSYDDEGNEQSLIANQDYFYNGFNEIRIAGAMHPHLKVVYQAGYALPDEVPTNIRAALLQDISLQYKNRQDPNQPKIVVNGLTLEARNLLQSEIEYAL